MIYGSAQEWNTSDAKRVMLFGMSGLGKTFISNILRDSGDWFHYSVDYRIGTRYMGEHIADNFKHEAMRVPLLRDLLLTDSVFIQSNITFNNLAPLSTYLGKPGNPELGGLPFEEYMRRQALHQQAEINAMLDTGHFIDRARTLYGYDNFICDSSGSMCEVVNPDDPQDPVLSYLSDNVLIVWIEGSDDHTQELIRRFIKSPKPMYYQPDRLRDLWEEYKIDNNHLEQEINPNDFVRFAYSRALTDRQPRYRSLAENWGVTVRAEDVAKVKTSTEFSDLIADALESR